jgi:hypothetical protein
METMSKFKLYNEIVRVKSFAGYAPKGYKAIVLEDYKFKDADGAFISIIDKNWELVKPKWTIYNNEKAWEDLSDKQKGKMLLAAHNGSSFGGTDKTEFNNPDYAYKAKPEPTMAELFIADWNELGASFPVSEQMIAKGWNKPCK